MKRILFLLIVLLSLNVSAAMGFDHSVWDTLLREHVAALDDGRITEVNYAGMGENRAQLKTYLDSLAAVETEAFNGWSKADQLAFLINAYNAWTVELILTRYPDLDSIKDLGSLFRSPWKKEFIPLLGQTVSLDDIEHGMIRKPGSYDDPRIHFAVNCASIGCPALRPEAYQAELLEMQLADAQRLFLSDSTRNRFANGRFEVSSIFKWYGEDFSEGYLGIDSLEQYLLSHAELLGVSAEEKDTLTEDKVKISYLKYDWKLNTKGAN